MTISNGNAKVFEEVVFASAKRFEIPASGVFDIVFDTTNFVGSNVVLLPLSFKAYGSGPIREHT